MLTGGADIPSDPTDALRQNALSLTRIRAVAQCQQMTSLIDQVHWDLNKIVRIANH